MTQRFDQDHSEKTKNEKQNTSSDALNNREVAFLIVFSFYWILIFPELYQFGQQRRDEMVQMSARSSRFLLYMNSMFICVLEAADAFAFR